MKRIVKESYGYGYSYGYGGHQQEDRLTPLSDDLLISILSYVDTKLAVQSSVLSKRWVNIWRLLPVININCEYEHGEQSHNNNNNIDAFGADDFFIRKVLTLRDRSIKIDRLNIAVKDYKTMGRVFRDAVSLGVGELRIDCSENVGKYYPVSGVSVNVNSSDLVTSLSLKGMMEFGYFPRFDGLVSLRLDRVKIVEAEPFSCFPNLGELVLVNCKMGSGLDGLEMVAPGLSRLTISSCFHTPVAYKRLVLLTPNLEVLELEGLTPMVFEPFDDLRVLHTVHIDTLYSSIDFQLQKLHLMGIFASLKHAQCVHLSPSTVEFLTKCESLLVEEQCPFEDLKVLNLIPPPNKPAPQLDSFVAAYLLKDYPKANVKSFPRFVGMACRPTDP
ncbi:FBD-associated F-box protein At5g60610-like [Bidens hawaiensis]|uniref:FBD-associated F-box protein At5g60610-like n=1 Tax=Bidens hawaiensis TaxID=980011 RepID=UPI0040494A25